MLAVRSPARGGIVNRKVVDMFCAWPTSYVYVVAGKRSALTRLRVRVREGRPEERMN